MILNIGCGRHVIANAVNMDLNPDGTEGVEKGDIYEIPRPDDCFDVVMAYNLLEHLSDLPRAMSEIHRILKPGGLLYVDVPYGKWAAFYPFHIRVFTRRSLPSICVDRRYSSGTYSLEQPRFELLWQRTYISNMPLLWHIHFRTPRLGRLFDRLNRRIELPLLHRSLRACLKKVKETPA